MANGYTGNVLFVDLASGEQHEERLDDRLYRDFLGGYGLGVRLLYERQLAGVDPLGPEAILGFSAGLLCGTGAPFAERYAVVGKSPLTRTWGDSNAGGLMGSALKRAGFDAVFCHGVARRPVWLHLHDGGAELRDATDLWGLDTRATEEQIRGQLRDDRAAIASIGPAGEARSLIAAIISDGGRAAGRSGLGAVMGAKRLKALAVQGDKQLPWADEGGRQRIWAELRPYFAEPSMPRRAIMASLRPFMPYISRFAARRGINYLPDTRTMVQILREQGTAAMLAMSSEAGDAPVKNWSGIGYRDFPILSKSRKISDARVTGYNTRPFRCGGTCPLGCGGFVSVPKGPFALKETRRPEYETLAAFGTMPLNDNVEAVIKCNEICDRYGLDTISTGTAVAFAIECHEAGIIGQKDTGGLELTWGNAPAIVKLTQQIARREGLGEVLADGVARAAAQIGRGSESFAMHVHGQEPGMHDPRFAPSLAATYVTDPTPGRHTAGGLANAEARGVGFPLKGIDLPRFQRDQTEGKGAAHAAWSNLTQVINCSGVCLFGNMLGILPYEEMLNAVTGWGCTADELLLTGKRIQTMRQLFNVREGLRPADFRLPDRLAGHPPLGAGPTAGVSIDVDGMAGEYFAAMGWDRETGMPSPKCLSTLGLTGVAGHAG